MNSPQTNPESTPNNGLGAELTGILRDRFRDATCTYQHTAAAIPAHYSPWPDWVYPPLREQLTNEGVARLYSHQRAAAQLAHDGHHVVISTGTSSGKSLGYLLPCLTALAENRNACALYLTPTKALGSDQLQAVTRLTNTVEGLGTIHPAPYDGDTPTEARAGIREISRFLFATPDMLHASILRGHHRFTRLLRGLRFIIIDECHVYRGVFGANIALVLRRLLRLAASYGAHPVVILASATTNDPASHAELLTGVHVTAVTEDGAPTGARTTALWEPGFPEGAEGINGAPVRRAATTEAADIMAAIIAEGARTLTFVRSRRAAEGVALRAAESLRLAGRPDFASRVASYRAGYLAEDRRRLEHQLDDGTLLGVATTSALELGIDVGGLDAVITAGFPGTLASFRQQSGRAGRRGQDALVVFVARDDPLDTYLVHHPEALLGKPVEKSVFNPRNPHVLRGHLYCAAVETPLADAEVDALNAHEVAAELEAEGLLRHRGEKWFATAVPSSRTRPGALTPESAHATVSLRGGVGGEVMIVDATDARLLGTVEQGRAAAQVHPGAVHLHQGESFVIDELDLAQGVALAHPEDPDYTTQTRGETEIHIISEPADNEIINPSPGLWVSAVDVEVTDTITGFVRSLPDGTILDQEPLDLPAQVLTTRAVAYTLDPLVLTAMGIATADIPGALHAAEHAAIGLLPLFATCDRWDIGGVSTARHEDTDLPTVFVYDGHPGGAGFADHGFAVFLQWITATFEAVRSCSCESGCPSCVQSPKCGNGNQPLDKAGAVKLLGSLVTMLSGLS